MLSLEPERWFLARARTLIDHVDDGLVVLLAARRRLVRTVGVLKARSGLPIRDEARERRVHARAGGLAMRWAYRRRRPTSWWISPYAMPGASKRRIRRCQRRWLTMISASPIAVGRSFDA
ncbi:MAG TPA: chorismate mutase [Dyella sp.]|uniref:chorismate mutase n=1 Tax=Dyella sp. TaxID=1869338 RepID=UPI002D7660E0|nr:chorismate mutase [Dyella sp.]HET6553588.1 chorismate mutase [Dyella sp.]